MEREGNSEPLTGWNIVRAPTPSGPRGGARQRPGESTRNSRRVLRGPRRGRHSLSWRSTRAHQRRVLLPGGQIRNQGQVITAGDGYAAAAGSSTPTWSSSLRPDTWSSFACRSERVVCRDHAQRSRCAMSTRRPARLSRTDVRVGTFLTCGPPSTTPPSGRRRGGHRRARRCVCVRRSATTEPLRAQVRWFAWLGGQHCRHRRRVGRVASGPRR